MSFRPRLWSYEREIVLAGWLPFPARMLVVQATSGEVAIISPLSVEESAWRSVESIGAVQLLVAPSLVHYLYLPAASRMFPRAVVWAPKGIERKVGSLVYQPLPNAGALPFGKGELEVLRVEGVPYVEEHVFFHWPSRTLLLTDLLFHVRRASSWRTRCWLRLMGSYGEPRLGRIWRFLVRDRARFARSLKRVLDWPFEQVLLAHGEPLYSDAHLQLARAWEAFLN